MAPAACQVDPLAEGLEHTATPRLAGKRQMLPGSRKGLQEEDGR